MDDLSLLSQLQPLLSQIPLWAEAHELHVTPLENVISLNNTNYRVTANGVDYLLRVAADTGQYLGIRREEEREAAFAVAKAGVGPEVLYFDEAGNMVSAFIPGRHWQQEDFQKEDNIARLAETLRRLHAIQEVSADGSVYRRIERLLASLETLKSETPTNLNRHREEMERIEAARCADSRFVPGLCHNDLWANNFLDDGQNLWLVDWEFAGNGDGLYDLTTIAQAGNYSEAQKRLLLETYGLTAPDDLASLHTLQYVVWFFEGAWALVQHGLRGSQDFDYLAYAQKMFAAMDNRLLETPSRL